MTQWPWTANLRIFWLTESARNLNGSNWCRSEEHYRNMPCPAELKRCLGRAGHRSCCNSTPVLHVWPRHFSAQIASKLMPWPTVPSSISHHYPSPSHKRSHKGTIEVLHMAVLALRRRRQPVRHWSSISESMLTLFLAISGGLSWEEALNPLRAVGITAFGAVILYIAPWPQVTQVWRKCDASVTLLGYGRLWDDGENFKIQWLVNLKISNAMGRLVKEGRADGAVVFVADDAGLLALCVDSSTGEMVESGRMW